MVAPISYFRKTLTGRVRGRPTWFKKVVMQVEVKSEEIAPWSPAGTSVVLGLTYHWRDATVADQPIATYGERAPSL